MRTPYASGRQICVQEFGKTYQRNRETNGAFKKHLYHHQTIQPNTEMLFANDGHFPFTCLPWSFASCAVRDVSRPNPDFCVLNALTRPLKSDSWLIFSTRHSLLIDYGLDRFSSGFFSGGRTWFESEWRAETAAQPCPGPVLEQGETAVSVTIIITVVVVFIIIVVFIAITIIIIIIAPSSESHHRRYHHPHNHRQHLIIVVITIIIVIVMIITVFVMVVSISMYSS